MTTDRSSGFETIIFDYIDQLKFIFFPDQWSNAFLDYSKNEILALIFLYRNNSVNMTEISAYINAPLNTTTGVVSRLEKKQMVERRRDDKDRRIVNIVLTEKAYDFINKEKNIIKYYFDEVYKQLTDEEKSAVYSVFNKVITTLKKDKNEINNENRKTNKIKRITIE